MDKWVKTTVPSGFNTGDMAGISQMFDGRVYVYGLNSKAYIWTPGATVTDPGSWVTTALITTNGATENEDEYTDTLPNGMVWSALVAKMYGPSVVLQQFDPTTNTATAVTGQPKETNPDPIDYLNLPNGQVMITVESGSHNWVLTPDGQPQDAWRPTVTSVTYNSATNNYTLTGTQISGLINGGDEGDDMTMAENYPIIWLKDSSGNVYYCKSSNFSNMMPSKGSTPETADFTLPTTVTSGSYQLYVSAVGVISKNPLPLHRRSEHHHRRRRGQRQHRRHDRDRRRRPAARAARPARPAAAARGERPGAAARRRGHRRQTTGTGGTTTTGTGGTTTGPAARRRGTGGTTTGTGGAVTTGTGGTTAADRRHDRHGRFCSTGGATGSGGTTTGEGGTTGETGAASGCSCATAPGGGSQPHRAVRLPGPRPRRRSPAAAVAPAGHEVSAGSGEPRNDQPLGLGLGAPPHRSGRPPRGRREPGEGQRGGEGQQSDPSRQLGKRSASSAGCIRRVRPPGGRDRPLGVGPVEGDRRRFELDQRASAAARPSVRVAVSRSSANSATVPASESVTGTPSIACRSAAANSSTLEKRSADCLASPCMMTASTAGPRRGTSAAGGGGSACTTW